ncbi:MAG: hypothetical protein IKB70_01070 [Bacilli bacterium]|nr:hypothetical protein [Bacilli bacterium]
MNLLAKSVEPIIVLVIVIAVAGGIALVAYLIYRFTHPKIKQEEQVDERKAAEEELERILQPIEDEEIAKEVANYVDEEDE